MSQTSAGRRPRSAARRRRLDFEPQRYRSELATIIHAIGELPEASNAALDRILRRNPRDGRGFFSRSQLISGYRYLAASERFSLDEPAFLARVQRRPVRSLSGVIPLTVFTRPHPCPGRCVFCPNDVRMPKSYLSDEPGAQRAADNRFDPYLQTWNRLVAFRATGHPTDKVEVIVLGGTWSFYPEAYQRWFVLRVFDALNDFGAGGYPQDRLDGQQALDRQHRLDGQGSPDGQHGLDAQNGARGLDFEALPAWLDGRAHEGDRYNRIVGAWLRESQGGGLAAADESASWDELEAAHSRNEEAASRCVGLVFETRPDEVDASEVARLRRLGATKVQLGIQSLSDDVLRANQRGHDVAATRRALRLLRAAGFKLHAHWMPNLLGATPREDIADFARLFDDPDFRPDELKVYPCSLVESAELVQHWERGEWRPYSHAELLEVTVEALARTPRWCRLTRVIRDISSDDILVGNKRTNFREIAELELKKRGGAAHDMRAREVRGESVAREALALRTTEYATSVGRELFLEFASADRAQDRLAGFLRLSLPDRGAAVEAPPELAGCAVIRELHVYGAAEALGARSGGRAQHRGLGRELLREAEARASAAGFAEIAVISAVGTRAYYRARGYQRRGLYQARSLR
jgi:elongator complex protein 3